MTSQERITKALKHEPADRVAIQDSPWATTIARWHKEGLPQKISRMNSSNLNLSGMGLIFLFDFP